MSLNYELGVLQEAVDRRVLQLASIDAPRRIWNRDPTLWSDDPAAQEEIRRRMGWLESPARSRVLLPEIARLVKELQAEGLTHVLWIGMGGASLVPEVLTEIFGQQKPPGGIGLALQILDSIDPAQVRAAARWAPLETTLFIIASKSGSTLEITANLEYFWSRARRRLGDKVGRHFVAITDPGTPLEKLAFERRFRRVFLSDLSVGGRFSALTAFGLLPAGLLGVDLRKLLERAAAMAAECGPDLPSASNPGVVLGAVLGEAALRGRDKLTVMVDPPLACFGAWLEQLAAHSSGKQGKGIVPVDTEPQVHPDNYGSDRIFICLRSPASGDGRLDRRALDLRQRGHPVITFSIQDPYDLGAEFFRWQFAITVACAVLGINYLEQPGVLDSRARAEARIRAFRETRVMDEGIPIWEGAGGRVYGWDFPGLHTARTLVDVVRIFGEQARENDYIAINAYLPRSARVLARLQKLRESILKVTGRATTLGFGPRFLHSTGHLQKGEANNGLFLQITQESPDRLEIPGQEMTFGALETAQALADMDALLARGKRAIRVHLLEGDVRVLLSNP